MIAQHVGDDDAGHQCTATSLVNSRSHPWNESPSISTRHLIFWPHLRRWLASFRVALPIATCVWIGAVGGDLPFQRSDASSGWWQSN